MRLQFGILESFDGPAPQNDTPLAKMQAALEAERAGFLALKQQVEEERDHAFREGYGRAREEVSKMSAEEYAVRAVENLDRLLELERQNTAAVIELSEVYAGMTFDILAAILPECAERAVTDDLLKTLTESFRNSSENAIVVRACTATAERLTARAAVQNMTLPSIEIDDTLADGDLYAERGALRYRGSRNEFLTSAMQCLRRYLTPMQEHAPRTDMPVDMPIGEAS